MSYDHLQRHLEEELANNPCDANTIEEFIFPETAFITVTAYQNQQVSVILISEKCRVCLSTYETKVTI